MGGGEGCCLMKLKQRVQEKEKKIEREGEKERELHPFVASFFLFVGVCVWNEGLLCDDVERLKEKKYCMLELVPFKGVAQYIYIRIYIYMYIHIVCIYMYMYTSTHTYIHILT